LIFVTVGSQKFQFNRLLQYIDDLVEKQIIQDDIFAQTGFSDYEPLHYTYKPFLDREEFHRILSDSDIIITHGGAGTIMGAIKAGKRVIAVPRLSCYDEHVDDHQEQIISELINNRIIPGVTKLEELEAAVLKCPTFPIVPYQSNTKAIINSIDQFIREIQKPK
jgi:UDP-N-acetylglucosamine transferase subunit ALG13